MTPIMAIWILVFLGSAVLAFRQRLEERTTRWRMYALRDELRDAAYLDPVVRRNPLFLQFDKRLSHLAELPDDISLVCMWPVYLADKAGREVARVKQEEIDDQLERADLSEIRRIYHSAAHVMTRHLLWRHLAIAIPAAMTVVGGVLLFIAVQRTANGLVSGALLVRPIGNNPFLGLRLVR